MELSLFGQKFTSKSGILQLMDDLGKPLSPDVPAYRLGGGNPARIPEIEKIFRREMYRILEDGDNFERTIGCYDSPQGRESFLTAMARLLSLKFGWKIGPENIAVTNGSQSGFFYLFNMFSGNTGKGKKNKILFPLVPEYVGYADQGIEPDTFVTLPAKAEYYENNTFKYFIDFQLLEDYLSKHPEISALCVSRPTNPTGNVLTNEEIVRLANTAEKFGIHLMVDNAYGTPFPNIIFNESQPYWDPSVILSMSLSKIGLPTTRTGIIIAEEKIIKLLSAVNSIIALASTSIGQAIAENLVLSGEILKISKEIVQPFYQNRAIQTEKWIREIFKDRNWMLHKSEGAIFQWLRLCDMPFTSLELYKELKNHGVIVVPGEYFFFGEGGINHEHLHQCIRINYSGPQDEVYQGLKIIEEVSRAGNS